MRTKLLYFLGAGTIGLLVLTAIVWSAGCRGDVRLCSSPSDWPRQVYSDGEFLPGERVHYLKLAEGRLALGMRHHWRARGWEAISQSREKGRGPYFGGFEFHSQYQRDMLLAWFVSMPVWFPGMLAVGLWAPWFILRLRRLRSQLRFERGRCPACGYDLRASKERCPECGTPFEMHASSVD